MRLVIEVGLGDLLFLRRHNIDFKKLNDIIKKEQKATQKIEIVKYDIEFHSMLYQFSGNETIMRFQKMLLPIFDHVYAKLSESSDAYSKNAIEEKDPVTHQDLVNTLKDGTLETFRSQMRKHLMVYFRKVNTD